MDFADPINCLVRLMVKPPITDHKGHNSQAWTDFEETCNVTVPRYRIMNGGKVLDRNFNSM